MRGSMWKNQQAKKWRRDIIRWSPFFHVKMHENCLSCEGKPTIRVRFWFDAPTVEAVRRADNSFWRTDFRKILTSRIEIVLLITIQTYTRDVAQGSQSWECCWLLYIARSTCTSQANWKFRSNCPNSTALRCIKRFLKYIDCSLSSRYLEW